MEDVKRERDDVSEQLKTLKTQKDDLAHKGRKVETERNDFLMNSKLIQQQKENLEARNKALQRTNDTFKTKVNRDASKHVWHLKQNKTDFTIKWSIIIKSIFYTGGSKRCNLCLDEKHSILKQKKNNFLLSNKRSEIVSACQHKNRFQVNNLNKERNAS